MCQNSSSRSRRDGQKVVRRPYKLTVGTRGGERVEMVQVGWSGVGCRTGGVVVVVGGDGGGKEGREKSRSTLTSKNYPILPFPSFDERAAFYLGYINDRFTRQPAQARTRSESLLELSGRRGSLEESCFFLLFFFFFLWLISRNDSTLPLFLYLFFFFLFRCSTLP